MGANAAETVEEIEDLRSRLDVEIRELESRIPPPSVLARRAALGAVATVSVAGAATWVAQNARRRVREAATHRWARRVRARQTTVQRADAVVLGALREPRWRMLVLTAAAVSVLTDVMGALELRRLRRTADRRPEALSRPR